MEKVYTIDDLMQAIKESGRSYDTDRIMAAYQVAKEAHKDQRRRSGEPYISHPVAVAIILVGLGMDTETLVAALLHDVVEDTATTGESIEKQFGEDVALMVNGVTKLGQMPFSTREEQQAENVRKMLLAMAQDVRVIIIKLADRLHNMRTLESMPPQKQRDKSLETMEVYAPLAHRLGSEGGQGGAGGYCPALPGPGCLFNEIESQLVLRKDERDKFLSTHPGTAHRAPECRGNALPPGEPGQEHLRHLPQGVYQGRDFDEIFDVYAVRVIVDTVIECYNVLGVVHDMFRPIPNRFKDYISTPKANMYQSLHTTVLDKEGIPFEIQIRTWDMHYTAEYGVAAHWKYKVGIAGKDSLEERLSWVRQLLEAQKESDDVEDIVRSIKTDIAPEEVFVFTPKGDVISLPVRLHRHRLCLRHPPEVGNRMVGAKVDGRMVSLDFEVKTGMIVEVITSKAKGNGPSRDWLKMVKTSEAGPRSAPGLKRRGGRRTSPQGREEVEREFRRNLINLPETGWRNFSPNWRTASSINAWTTFWRPSVTAGSPFRRSCPASRRLSAEYRTTEAEKAAQALPKLVQKKSKASSGVIVEGLDSCLVKFAQCCNPLPGDEIIGFITRGSGVSIHKLDCPNVINSMKDPEQQSRWVAAEWADTTQREVFKSSIELLARDRGLLLAEVSITLNNMHVPLHALQARELKDGMTSVTLTLGTVNVEQLTNIMSNLRKIDGVVEVKRANQ